MRRLHHALVIPRYLHLAQLPRRQGDVPTQRGTAPRQFGRPLLGAEQVNRDRQREQAVVGQGMPMPDFPLQKAQQVGVRRRCHLRV
ncbi:hypothetical protein SRABI111_01945 [Pseudomonas carnis]|nr:hypothetical protein SRABI111_01945 [Pseudomonas carnis]